MTVRRRISLCAAFLLAAASFPASAQWRVQYEGPDSVTLVSRPNMAATNARTAVVQTRELRAGDLEAMLAPIVGKALQGCAMEGVTRVVISPQPSADRIGETMSRLRGFGIYVNLPLADRVSNGTWFIAPFFAINVSLFGDSGARESFDLSEFDRAIIHEQLPMTQDRFFDARDEDLLKAVTAFSTGRLPDALRKGLAKRCP